MKKIALVAAATLALVACQGETTDVNATNEADLNLTTENVLDDVNAAAVDAQNAADAALDNASAAIDNAGEAVENAADAVETNVQ